MHEAIDPQTSGLLCYYDFDQSSGSTIADRTGNSHDGILHNMVGADWEFSTAPMGDQGITVRTTTPTSTGNSGANITATITSSANQDNYLGIYTSGDGADHIDAEDFPSGITQRADIIWGVEEFGAITSDLQFDYTNILGISDETALHLLKR